MLDEVLVKCERLDNFGRGVSKVGGKVIFVPDLFPGEVALVRITIDKKKFMVGEVISLKEKSKDRIISKCPYDKCGCAFKNLNYEKTLVYKKEKVLDLLKRFGNIDIKNVEIVSSQNIYNYRNKITLKVKNGKIGYFKNGSNDLIEIDKCMLASERTNEIIGILKKEDLSCVREVIIKDMDEVMISIDGDMDISNLKSYADSIYLNEKCVYGKEKIINSLFEYKFLVSKDSFFQVNKDVTLKLYSKVLEYAGSGEKAVDLYCGTGTISILLSKFFDSVSGIEINSEAVLCANENKELNNINNVSFKCGDANKLVKGMSADVIVVDPARAGLMDLGIKNILEIKPKKIVYVSCDPVTLSRDLKELNKYYDVKDVTLFDMFPFTYHVECVCLLCKIN